MTELNPAALLEKLFDERTFTEIQKYADSSVVAGSGKVEGITAYAYVQDISVKSGAVNTNAAAKIKNVYASAVKYGAPVVAVFNSKGGEISEGIELIGAFSGIIGDCARLSGVVPMISVVTGQCSGLNATLCCMSDFVIMTEKSEMFFTPPFVAGDKVENAGKTQLNAQAGAASIIVNDASDAVLKARSLLSLLPPNNLETVFCGGFERNDAVITESIKSEALLSAIADKGSLIEINSEFGSVSVTALGVLDSCATGFVMFDKAGKLTADDAAKIARFVNICDAFSLPVISMIDNDGFEPSMNAERAGFVRDTAKLAQIYASSTTPKISLITGKAVGAAFILAGGFKSDFVLAYEDAVICPVSTKAAAVFLEQPEEDYIKNHAGVQNALKKGYIDAVITPSETRDALIKALDAVRGKRVTSPSRKHINIVL